MIEIQKQYKVNLKRQSASRFLASVAIAASLMGGHVAPATAAEDTPQAAPNLIVTKTGVQPANVDPTGSTVFTIRYQNRGNAPATGIVITETFSTGAEFEPSLSTPGWTCNFGVCTFEPADLSADPGGSIPPVEITFAIAPNDDLPAQDTSVSNTVVIGDDGKNGADSAPANNTFTVVAPFGTKTTLVGKQTAVLVTDANGDGQYAPNDVIEYSFVITNTGTRYANALQLFNPFDPSWAVQIVGGSGTSSQGSNTASTNEITFTLGTLAPGQSATARFQVTGSTEPPLILTEFDNVAQLADSYGYNTTTNVTFVPVNHAPYAATASKRNQLDANAKVNAGDVLTYTIVVTNTGSLGFADLKLVDEVNDAGGKAQCITVNAASISTSRGAASFTQPSGKQRIEVSFGAMANGDSATVSFNASVRSSAGCQSAFNQAEVFSGTSKLAETNVVSNALEKKQVFLPMLKKP